MIEINNINESEDEEDEILPVSLILPVKLILPVELIKTNKFAVFEVKKNS